MGQLVDSNHQDGLDVVEMDPVNDEVVVDEEGKQSIKYLRDRPEPFLQKIWNSKTINRLVSTGF